MQTLAHARVATMLALAGLLACAPTLHAQAPAQAPAEQAPPARKPKQSTPVLPAAPTDTPATNTGPLSSPRPAARVKAPVPVPGKLVTKSQRSDDSLVTIRVNVLVETRDTKAEVRTDPKTGKPMTVVTPTEGKPTMAMESMSMLLPYVEQTASSDVLGKILRWEEQHTGEYGFKARLLVADALVDFEPEIIKGTGQGYPGGVQLAKLGFVPKEKIIPPSTEAIIEMAVRTHDTVYDEAGAMRVGWPAVWPDECSSALQSRLWIDQGPNPEKANAIEDYKTVGEVLTAYLKEEGLSDAKALPPAALAKMLTQKVWRDIQPSGDGLVRGRDTAGRRTERASQSMLSGFEVQAPFVTAARQRGTPFDMVALLVALCKEAGLPARPVIAIDTVGDGSGYDRGARGRETLRCWMEFALYDQQNNTLNWVPVDVVRLRKQSQRPAKLDQPWKYFGTHDELRRCVPVALSFAPPTDVAVYGHASLWGWFVTPKPPEFVEQRLTFSVATLPKRSGEPPAPAREQRRGE